MSKPQKKFHVDVLGNGGIEVSKGDVHDWLRRVVKETARQHLIGGALLQLIKEHELWKDVGCASFTDYLSTYPGICPTTARRWMRVYAAFGKLKFDKELILGPTKMSVLAEFVTQENVDGVLRWASSKSLFEIKRKFYGSRRGQREHARAFWLSKDEAELVDDVVNLAMEKNGAKTKGEALVMVIWAAAERVKLVA